MSIQLCQQSLREVDGLVKVVKFKCNGCSGNTEFIWLEGYPTAHGFRVYQCLRCNCIGTKNLAEATRYLVNELFRFGGINSIRGFNENSIDASFYSVLNSEYRYQFNQDIYIHSIIDFAYFENQITALKQKLYSFGIGIGIQTSAGIIKFSIANGNAEHQDFNFSNTKIHISISSKF